MSERNRPLIVVGVDGSEHSGNALRRAMAEAEVKDAELHVVYVTDLTMAYHFVADSVVVDVGELARIQRDAVWQETDTILEGADVQRVNLEGYPADTLVDYCAEHDADLLVVGTRGRGRLASTFLGSTSMRAVEHAKCDVLIAKPR